jgi:hypothetical protein
MGRPRQPNCPDCLKAGIKRPKARGSGYCDECHKRRQRVYKGYTDTAPTIEDALALKRGEIELENGRIPMEEVILREVRVENEHLKVQNKELEHQLYIQEAFLRDSENAELWSMNRDLRGELDAIQDQNRGLKATLLQALMLLKEHGKLPMQLQATLELLQSEAPSNELAEEAEVPGSQG